MKLYPCHCPIPHFHSSACLENCFLHPFFLSTPIAETTSPTATMSTENFTVPNWLTKLVGKSNWLLWRLNIEEAINEVHNSSVYWEIIMDKPDHVIRESFEASRVASTNAKSESLFYPLSGHSDDDSDVVIMGSSNTNKHTGLQDSGLRVYNRSRLNIRARQILASSLELAPKMLIDRISDPHEAYLKLESFYGDISAQSIFVAWEKLLKVRYYPRGLPPDRFVERFQFALHDVRDLGVSLSPTVELALFQQAIKSHCNSTKFMANMKVSIYAPDFMDSVYDQFLKDQRTELAPSMTILDALR